MIIFLRNPQNFLILACVVFLMNSFHGTAQQGNAANFSIYGDLYSGSPTQSALSDDWFQGYLKDAFGNPTAIKAGGFGMIDEDPTLVAQYTQWTNDKLNLPFTLRSPYNQYKELNGFLLYDAVYGRDHVDFGSRWGGRDKTAFPGNAGKNGDNPTSWGLGTDETVQSSNDIVDVFAHLRRAGVNVGTNMWLTLGLATVSNAGSHYVDFELYKSPIELREDGLKFRNSGPSSTGGHSAWVLDASGNVTSSGDMIAAFEVTNSFVSNVILRIWTKKTTWSTITPANFSWGTFIDGSNGYGYAEILIPASGVKSTGNTSFVTAPPWGTFYDNSTNPVTDLYAPGYFAEVGINLSTLGIDPSLDSGNPCDAPFTKLLVKSRSSATFTSTLKDYAGPYNFLGSSVVDTQIAKSAPAFNCTQTTIDLSPANPQIGSYYYWSTVDGQFSDGSKMVVGQNATATMPGTYRLAAAPLEGCTESFDEITLLAEPCANDDTAEVVENQGSVAIDVLANDIDLDGDLDPTSVKNASLKLPDNGSVVINPTTGVMTYTPNPDFYGTDTFEYEVFDETPNGNPHHGPYSDIAMVTVTVLRDSDGEGIPDRDDIDDDNDGIPDTLEAQSNGQPACGSHTVLNFNSYTEEPGNDGNTSTFTPGEKFRYLNVASGIDAIVTIKSIGGKAGATTIPVFDNNSTNPNSFQPRTAVNNLNTGEYGGAEYQFEFVDAGTNTPRIIPEFFVNFNDIDGNTSGGEQNWSYDPVSYTVDSPTSLTIDNVNGWIRGSSGTTEVTGADNTSPFANFSTRHINLSTFSIRVSVIARVDGYSNGGRNHNIEFNCLNNYYDPITIDESTDVDGDNIPNYLDLDSDNDGIPDVREAGFRDNNNDGLADTGSYGTNGLADELETSPDSGILRVQPRNTDASTDIKPGLYDFLDLDSDNDGLTDTMEAFHGSTTFTDNNHDGRIDGFRDNDGNGWHDPLHATATFTTINNSDYDNLYDYIDLDSDGDGIPDTLESNAEVPDTDNDGIVGEGTPGDDDQDGLANTNDPDFSGNVLSGSAYHQDRDNDGLPNHLDIDSDNDGIVDNTEAQSTFSYIDIENEDSDGDGLDDAYDITPGGVVVGIAIGYIDIDTDAVPDYLDPNTDDDGEWDLTENHFNNGPSGGPSDLPLDRRNNATGVGTSDGMVDTNITDTGAQDDDGDGLANIFDLIDNRNSSVNIANATNDGQNPLTQPDLENPGGSDRDWREKVKNDNDNDGISDLNDLDDDNDGILDTTELAGSNNDIDSDGLPNSFDLDSDGDGLPDHIEANGTASLDEDGNGMPGSGLLGTSEVDDQGVPHLVTDVAPYNYPTYGVNPIDTDGDSISDYLDLDSDNDGISDVIEAGGLDPDGNGRYGTGTPVDLDTDGLADAVDFIYNNDNPDTVANEEGNPMSGTPLTNLDTADGFHKVLDSDGDSHPDYIDLDSDDDTIPDNVEAQPTLTYVAYSPTDTDNDGIVDNYDLHQNAYIVPVDTDGDDTPDYLDLDSDDDSLFDIEEAHDPVIANIAGRTTNNVGVNGLDDNYDDITAGDTFADPNGILDDTQTDNFPDLDQDVLTGGDVDYRDDSFNDFDEDGIADNIDLDDDNDGVLDTAESYGNDPLLDGDGDGIPNYLDGDFCSSGSLNSFGICPEFDLDEDGKPNHLDLDSDGDGCSDALEAGATTDITTNFQFPVSPVGTDGVPDAVQTSSGNNSGEVDYTILEYTSGTYDFLNSAIDNACSADLSLNKTVNDDKPKIGDVITFTLTLTNIGPFSVSQVKVKDIIPSGLLNITGNTTTGSFDPATGIWDLSGVTIDATGPDNEVTLEISATVGPNCGPITTTAEVISSERFDPDSTPNNGK